MIPFEYLHPASPNIVRPGISFVEGDLTEILRKSPVDALMVSAFRDDYRQTERSLIGSLARAGVDVGALAAEKADDLRSVGRCWLSKQLPPMHSDTLGFKRIICFEPERDESLEKSVMAIGQALSVITTTHRIRTIAMPLIATGDQGFSIQSVLPPLLKTLTRHMRPGSRLASVVVSVFDGMDIPAVQEQVALFRTRPTVSMNDDSERDVFVSYSHRDKETVDRLITAITKVRPETNFWLDRQDLRIGHTWNDEIAHAIDHSRLFVPCFSNDYFKSLMCGEELTAAHIRRRVMNKAFIFPLLLDDVKLTSYHQMTQYKDVRTDGDERFAEAARDIAWRLDGEFPDWASRSESCERCALT